MNTTEKRWEVGFWQVGKGYKHPVQFSWFGMLDELNDGGKHTSCSIPVSRSVIRSIIRKIVPVRLDKCPIGGKAISVTFPWIGLFFRFRPFHPKCIGCTIYDLDEFHESRWYHHPVNLSPGGKSSWLPKDEEELYPEGGIK